MFVGLFLLDNFDRPAWSPRKRFNVPNQGDPKLINKFMKISQRYMQELAVTSGEGMLGSVRPFVNIHGRAFVCRTGLMGNRLPWRLQRNTVVMRINGKVLFQNLDITHAPVGC